MILHLTEKMRKKLHCPALQPPSRTAAPHLGWYAHLITAERVQYLLTTNADSLYSVVMYEDGISDEATYIRGFLSTLRGHLEEDGFGPIYTTCIAPHTGNIELAKTADPSVLASVKSIGHQSERMIARWDLSPRQLTQNINTTPYASLGFSTPREAFACLPLD